MKDKHLKRIGKPKLMVECDNITTLLAVASVINESGLKAKVLLEYDISDGGKDENTKEDGACDT